MWSNPSSPDPELIDAELLQSLIDADPSSSSSGFVVFSLGASFDDAAFDRDTAFDHGAA